MSEKKRHFPNAGWISDRTVGIPSSLKLKDKDIEDVVKSVTHIITHIIRRM